MEKYKNNYVALEECIISKTKSLAFCREYMEITEYQEIIVSRGYNFLGEHLGFNTRTVPFKKQLVQQPCGDQFQIVKTEEEAKEFCLKNDFKFIPNYKQGQKVGSTYYIES